MGLRKLFKGPKDLDDKQATKLLESNGIPMKDKSNYDRKKYKFGEFDKYTQENVKLKDNTLRPTMPNVNTGYGSYDNTDNQMDSNQGYGYDEYANEFKQNSSNGSNGNGNTGYSGGYSSEYGMQDKRSGSRFGRSGNNSGGGVRAGGSSGGYGYEGNTYSSQTRDARNGGVAENGQRRPKVNSSAASGYSYQPSSSATAASSAAQAKTRNRTTGAVTGALSSAASIAPSNGYEPSINNYQPGGGYGYDPYSESSVTSKATAMGTAPVNGSSASLSKTATRSTYDPYAPGEEPYGSDVGHGNGDAYDDIYGAYGGGDDDANTITGGAGAGAGSDVATAGLNDGFQALQLQEEDKQRQTQTQTQTQEHDEDFDPYGPSSTTYASAVDNDLDLNAYEPTQEQTQPYDGDEFEEELDEDEEELNRIQRQTKDVREDTVNLSRTLVDNLGQANSTATNTLGVLGNQREKIYEMENNLGTMKVQQRFVDDHVKQLEHYNRSLFHVKVNNPFTRNSRRRAKDQEFLAQRQQDRANKDQLNNSLYQSQRAIMEQMKDDGTKSDLQEKYDYERRVREASKYLTKDHDEEDERMEVEIAANVEQAQKLAQNLKKKAHLMNTEIQQQNSNLKVVSENVDHMDDKLVMTTRRIRGI